MNKFELMRDYKAFLKKYKLIPEDASVGAGGAMVMYGLRSQTDDIDLDVPRSLFNQFAASHANHHFHNPERIEVTKNIDLHIRENDVTCMNIDGVCCYTPEETLRLYTRLNRPKDQQWIKVLKEYIDK